MTYLLSVLNITSTLPILDTNREVRYPVGLPRVTYPDGLRLVGFPVLSVTSPLLRVLSMRRYSTLRVLLCKEVECLGASHEVSWLAVLDILRPLPVLITRDQHSTCPRYRETRYLICPKYIERPVTLSVLVTETNTTCPRCRER